jgi:hypothetical protein
MGLVSDIQIYKVCDISAFYFGADFPFNIGLYNIHVCTSIKNKCFWKL